MLHLFSALRGAAAMVLLGTVAATAQGLPGGATSLNETHGDWTVTCAVPEGTVRCAMTQTQVQGESRQRVLAVELAPSGGGSEASGILVLPFGLRLDAGVRLAIEEDGALPVARFSTCLPAGCVVPLVFDAVTVAALRVGTAISVKVVADDSGQELVFPISLSGFASALDRVAQLVES